MSATNRVWYCLPASTLLPLLAPVAAAQVPQAAVEASIAGSAPDPVLVQTPAPQLGQAGATTPDEGASDDFLQRYAPEPNLLEVGLFLGPLFISDLNSFRGPIVVNPGRPPTVMPVSTFEPAPEIGLRGGYYPLTFLGAELEGMLAVAQTRAGGSATVLAARTHAVLQTPYWSVVPFALAGVGYWVVRNDVSGNDSDPSFHFGGGAKVHVSDNLAVRLDVRDSITNQRGDNSYPHNIEALAGANLVFGRKPPAPRDSDADGVLDASDRCPLEAGPTPHGCPVRDTDFDGIVDNSDQCMREAGVAPTGCPIRDADGDGVPDGEDQCIAEQGGAPTGCPDRDQDGFLDRADGCPDVAGVSPDGCAADSDSDGFVGAGDRCPDQAEIKNGFEDTDGCPDELPLAVKEFVGVIAGIEFDNNQASIRPSSARALEKALSVLMEYPSVRIEITGHTDNRGSHEHNFELSQRRADAVKEHLVSRGVDANRIQTKGAGPDIPLTTNDTAAGRQKNRRIEFRVVE